MLQKDTVAALQSQNTRPNSAGILLMIYILHYLKDPKLWKFWYIPYYG